MVEANWRVGFLIVEDEQKGKRKAEYGKAVLRDLAHRLTAEYGSGYDESNLRYMRSFYLAFPIRDALRHELSWTHYIPSPSSGRDCDRGLDVTVAAKAQTLFRQ